MKKNKPLGRLQSKLKVHLLKLPPQLCQTFDEVAFPILVFILAYGLIDKVGKEWLKRAMFSIDITA